MCPLCHNRLRSYLPQLSATANCHRCKVILVYILATASCHRRMVILVIFFARAIAGSKREIVPEPPSDADDAADAGAARYQNTRSQLASGPNICAV